MGLLVQAPVATGWIVPATARGSQLYRLRRFEQWLTDTGRDWTAPDLGAYRDELLAAGLAPATVAGHLSAIRSRCRELLRDPAVRQALFEQAGQALADLGQPDDPANRAAFVGELVHRIENAIDPAACRVRTVTRQDRPDADHRRLTREQASALLAAPGVATLMGLRDTALIGLMLCTGVREAELVALEVQDLRQRLGGELALHVREGKGAKERLVPYGAMDWVLAIVDAWRREAGIEEGPVARGLWRGDALRPAAITTRQVQNILRRYPVVVAGELVTVRPHDLRRTYARRLYEAGVDPVALQQNLGHADQKTTLRYVGTLDAGARRPPTVYSFDVVALSKAPVQRVLIEEKE